MKKTSQKIDKIFYHAEESEKALERYLVARVKESGWRCLKYSNQTEVGYPDRLVVMPDRVVAWAELKSRACRPSAIQQKRIEELRSMGHLVAVLDSRQKIDEFMKALTEI